MSNNIITNDEYYKIINQKTELINSCITDTIQIAKAVIGENLIPLDLCFCGMLDRNINLAKGFISMINERNLTCAGAMLRIQIDNCLRLYAIYIAEDEDAVISYILEGKRINNLKDKKGYKMTDYYLKNQLEKYDKKLPAVYDNASGFIHFSAKSVFQIVKECKDNKISLQIGHELPEKRNTVLIECADAFLHYFKLFLNIMKIEADWKREYDKEWEEK